MSLVCNILGKMVGVTKSQKNFIAMLFDTVLGMRGRVNFSNMARQSTYHEKTFSRNFAKKFDYLMFSMLAIQQVFSPQKRYAIGFDQVFIPKSGKKTYGLGPHWNGTDGRAERGLEASGFSLIDVISKISYPLLALQTPPSSEIVDLFNSPDATRIDYYTHIMQEQIRRINEAYPSVKHAVVDAAFAKKKFVDGMNEVNTYTVCKLRSDANLRSLEFEQTVGRGRPKKYGDKIDVKNDDSFKYVCEVDIDNEIKGKKVKKTKNSKKRKTAALSTIDCYSVSLKQNVRIARLKYKTKAVLLFSVDFELSPAEIVSMYRSRFQIEFNFRDAKQSTGFSDCQARSKPKIHHHLNASFAALLLTRIQDVLEQQDGTENIPFSIESYKRRKHNEISLIRIFSNYGFDLSLIKSHPGSKNLIDYGRIIY